MSRKYITVTCRYIIFTTAKTYKEETMTLTRVWLALSLAGIACAQTDFDLLIKGGHVIDGKNKLSAVRDVAIKDGKIAAVAAEHRSVARREDRGRLGPVRDSGAGRYTRSRLPGPDQEHLRRRLLGPAAGWLHAPRRRDHGRRCRVGRMANVRRFQDPNHRQPEDTRALFPQHRGSRHGVGADRAEPRRTWTSSPRPTWR